MREVGRKRAKTEREGDVEKERWRRLLLHHVKQRLNMVNVSQVVRLVLTEPISQVVRLILTEPISNNTLPYWWKR